MDTHYIKEHAPMRKTFSLYTKLISDGSFWFGNCPICKEEDKSFLFSTLKKVFYCYNCKESGDVVDFISLVEGCTFKEAEQQLVNTWGIQPMIDKYAPVLDKLAKN